MISIFFRRFVACVVALFFGSSGALAVEGFIWYPGRENVQEEMGEAWFASNFTIKTPSFRTAWRRSEISVDGDAVVLRLSPMAKAKGAGTARGTDEDATAQETKTAEAATGEAGTAERTEGDGKDFVGAELQRRANTRYGRYEVVMKAASGEGVISSFFTYTGQWFNNPHDEIDIEFLGRDTTKLWAAAFSDGDRLVGKWIDLGYDAAEERRLYAFDWLPDRIIWYVGGEEILEITAENVPLPVTPSKVYLNIWAGGEKQQNWSGSAPDDTRASARYYCMSYQRLGEYTAQCSDRF